MGLCIADNLIHLKIFYLVHLFELVDLIESSLKAFKIYWLQVLMILAGSLPK